ncbi:hypothetical protein IGI49_002001 [Enterococcus sp. AZ071]
MDVQNAAKNHDRQLIEESFADFAAGHFSTGEHWIIFYQKTGLSSIEDKASSFVLYGKGSLVIREKLLYLSKENPLETINTFFKTHRLMDYHLMRRTCQSLKALPSLKVPIVNQHFALFPIVKPEESSWFSHLAIDYVREEAGICSVILTHGLTLGAADFQTFINQFSQQSCLFFGDVSARLCLQFKIRWLSLRLRFSSCYTSWTAAKHPRPASTLAHESRHVFQSLQIRGTSTLVSTTSGLPRYRGSTVLA